MKFLHGDQCTVQNKSCVQFLDKFDFRLLFKSKSTVYKKLKATN